MPAAPPRLRARPMRNPRHCMNGAGDASCPHVPFGDAERAMESIQQDGAQPAGTLFADVYDRLKAMAGRQLARGRAGVTLDTTSLVHDLYLRMSAQRDLVFAREQSFFAYAARAMRNLVIDHARQRLSARMGADWARVTLTASDEELVLASAESALALDEALTRLAAIDARAADVVELRYFAGLTLEQVAATLDVARRTIDRDWRFATAFLQSELA